MRVGLGPAAIAVVALGALTSTATAAISAPADNATTVTVSPTALAPRATLTLSGFSDCAVVDGHLVFTRYDGTADNVVVRAPQATRYDDAREKYPFTVRIPVPAQARPGLVRVYAEPFCGPPEEYPPSPSVQVRVVPGVLTVSVFPRRPVEGRRMRLTATTCNGPGGRVTFAVRAADDAAQVTAAVDGQGRARASVDVPRGVDAVQVSLPEAAQQCPGSRYEGARLVRVRRQAPPSPPAVTAAPPAPSPSVATPSGTVTAPSTPALVATAASDIALRAPGVNGAALAAIATAAAALAGALVVILRRRSRG